MPRILITGANSFIGANFSKATVNEIAREVSLMDTKPENIDFSEIDVVLHLAAIVHQSKKISETEYFRVNRDLCKRTAIHAKASGVKHFIFISTIKVYGHYTPGTGPWNEDSICYPEDSYGRSKFGAEQEIRKLEGSDFIVSIIRTPIVYGSGVTGNILKLIKLIEKFPLLPFGNVNNSRHYTYVENLAGFIDRIIDLKASGTFIAMDNQALSTTELVSSFSGLLNKKTTLFKLPKLLQKIGVAVKPEIFDRLYQSFYIDNSRTRQILDYNPPFTLQNGLAIMISSYMSEKKN